MKTIKFYESFKCLKKNIYININRDNFLLIYSFEIINFMFINNNEEIIMKMIWLTKNTFYIFSN